MSLITRCPVCETMFKVVADQFKVAQGWVRCGYCGEVFDAAQHLVAQESGAPAASVPDGTHMPETPAQGMQDVQKAPLSAELESRPGDFLPDVLLTVPGVVDTSDALDMPALEPVSVPEPESEPAAPDENAGLTVSDDVAAKSPQPSQALEFFHPDAVQIDIPPVQHFPVQDFSAQDLPVQASPAQPLPAQDSPEPISSAQASPAQDLPAQEASVNPLPQTALPDSAVPMDDVPVEPFLNTGDPSLNTAPADAVKPEPEPEPEPEVSFVRDARRKALWKRPLVRGFLGLLSLALLAALLLQWVLQHKDTLAARDPRLAPFLQALCVPLNCQIRPPRRIESLVIDSSSFSKTGPDLYRLSFVLKNTSAAVLEIPALEVTLTDGQQQALVRRVLAPREFGATAAMLAAHAELAAVVTLKVSGEPVAAPAASSSSPPLPVKGYRILAFYP
jgi:predicted Zn finger-like uncharacterized protein